MDEKYVFQIGGMTCRSCERLIARSINQIPGARLVEVSSQKARVVAYADEAMVAEIRKAIESAGYKALSSRKYDAVADNAMAPKENAAAQGENNAAPDENGTSPSAEAGKDTGNSNADDGDGGCCETADLKAEHVVAHLMSSKPEWRAERQLLLYSFAALTGLLVILAVVYFGLWRSVPKFESTILPLLAIGAVSVVSLVGSGYHFKNIRKPISCSLGMMEGMTFGMMAGFMIGLLLGATNGMFWGSLLGTAIGCAAGVWGGMRSGVMGVMEGIMAGVMSGTMGAMLSVMLIAEPVPIFAAFITAICIIILMALSYMNVKELGLLGKDAKIASFTSVASTSVIFFFLLAVLMIYGPKSGIVFGGI